MKREAFSQEIFQTKMLPSILIYSIFSTNISETALLTVRLGSGCTDLAPVVDKAVAEIVSLLWRNDFP